MVKQYIEGKKKIEEPRTSTQIETRQDKSKEYTKTKGIKMCCGVLDYIVF